MANLFNPEALQQQLDEEYKARTQKGLFASQQAFAQAPDLAGRYAALGSTIGQRLGGAQQAPTDTPDVAKAQQRQSMLKELEGTPDSSKYFFGGAKKFMEAGDIEAATMFLDYGSKLRDIEVKDTATEKPENLVNLINPETNKVISRRKGDKEVDTLVQEGWVETGEAEIKASDLKSGTEKEIEVNLGKLDNQIARLGTLSNGFNEKYLTWGERGKQYIQSLYLKAGGELSTESKSDKVQFETFKSDVLNNLNRYIKEITGAQMSEHEAKRIIKAQPNMGDDPVSFKAKLDNVTELMNAAAERSKYALANGYQHVGRGWVRDGETLGLGQFLEPTPTQAPSQGISDEEYQQRLNKALGK